MFKRFVVFQAFVWSKFHGKSLTGAPERRKTRLSYKMVFVTTYFQIFTSLSFRVDITGCLLIMSSLLFECFVTFVSVLSVCSTRILIKFSCCLCCGVWLCLNGVLCSTPSFSTSHDYFPWHYVYSREIIDMWASVAFFELHSFSNILQSLNIICNSWAPSTWLKHNYHYSVNSLSIICITYTGGKHYLHY